MYHNCILFRLVHAAILEICLNVGISLQIVYPPVLRGKDFQNMEQDLSDSDCSLTEDNPGE
jgi:hypothetical protein